MVSEVNESGFEGALERAEGKTAELIPLLQAAQASLGYIPVSAMQAISKATGVPLSQLYGVVTFYKQFRLTPSGKYVCKVCNGTACHVNGSTLLENTLEDNLGIKRGETDNEALFTLESVNCLGCCSLAPVVMVNDDTFGTLTPRKLTALLKKLRREAGGGATAAGTSGPQALPAGEVKP
jgi:NADH-quinone oxidoreductase subunit E